MKLHSPAFEKALRRGIKEAVRSSPALKKEYRRVNKAARTRSKLIPHLLSAVLPLSAGYFIWQFSALTGNPVTGVVGINLLALFLAAHYAQTLPMALFRSKDLAALSLLPLPESSVFHWELQKFLQRIVVFSLIAMLAAYAGLGVYVQLSFAQWIATFFLALLSWITLLAFAGLLAARLPRLPYQTFTGVACMAFLGIFFGWRTIGRPLLQFVDQIAPALNLMLPTGWSPSLFQILLHGGQWMFAALIIPTLLLIWTLKSSLDLLRGRLIFREYVRPEIADQIPSPDHNDPKTNEGSARPSPFHLGPTAVEEIVQTRQFLLREPWARRGWVEKLLWQWLNEREKTLAEFAFPAGLSITRGWKSLLRIFLVTVPAGLLVGRADVTLERWIIGIGLFITSLLALGLILENGSCFRVLSSSGVLVPIHAAYPITFRELSRMLFKRSIIQLPFFIAYTLVCGMLVSYLAMTPYIWGIKIGFKLGILLFSARFITTTLAFSSGTNDSTQFRLRTIVLVVWVVLSAVLFFSMGVGSLVVQSPSVAWTLWVAAMADAYALFRVYGWFYNTNKFDLMTVGRH